ncbi:hypothetical protein GJ496_008099 [Pomphorhynchus laevis]|nr:hypothetical protein GJ496_008099 [Pomphorhynchus laevis]
MSTLYRRDCEAVIRATITAIKQKVTTAARWINSGNFGLPRPISADDTHINTSLLFLKCDEKQTELSSAEPSLRVNYPICYFAFDRLRLTYFVMAFRIPLPCVLI